MVAVAYGRWLFYFIPRGANCKVLTGKILVFWIGGRLWPLFFFKDTKKTGLLILNPLKQRKSVFNFFGNRNRNKLTDSRKRANILAHNRKSHHPIETLNSLSSQGNMYMYYCLRWRLCLNSLSVSLILRRKQKGVANLYMVSIYR